MYLKQRARATALFVITLASLWVIISAAYDQAMKIVHQMQAQGIGIDMARITELSAQASKNTDDISSSLALFALLACWVVAIVDSYRLGKASDHMSKAADHTSKS